MGKTNNFNLKKQFCLLFLEFQHLKVLNLAYASLKTPELDSNLGCENRKKLLQKYRRIFITRFMTAYMPFQITTKKNLLKESMKMKNTTELETSKGDQIL